MKNKGCAAKYYYMAVTNNKYELPLSPPMRMVELAEFLGVSLSTLSHCIKRETKYPERRKLTYVKFLASDIDGPIDW